MKQGSRGAKQRLLGGAIVAAVGALLTIACVAPSYGPPGSTTSSTTTTTSTTLPWSPPTGQWFAFNLTCYFNVLGQYYNFPEYPTVNIEAPAQVQEGETFNLTITPGVFNVPTSVQGYFLNHLRWMTIRYPMPSNTAFVDSVLSAGIDSGPGYPSVTIEGDYIVYRVPGPFAPGAAVQMPKVRLTLTATGAAGSTIDTKFHSLTNTAQFDLGAVSNNCLPDNPAQVFTSTPIVAATP